MTAFPSVRVMVCLFIAPMLVAQSQPANLELGQKISGELAEGRPVQFTITASAGQFVRAVVSRPAFDNVIRLTEPGGKASFVELHWSRASPQREPFWWIARVSGEYRIELVLTEQGAADNKYEITLEELRSTEPGDQKQVEAQQLFENARVLDGNGDYQQAIATWNHALSTTRELKNRERESAALSGLALALANSTQYEKAIGSYEQSLAIRREIKDRGGEGAALNNLGNMYDRLRQYEKAIGYYEQALAIAREIKNRSRERGILNNLGSTSLGLSQNEKAIGYYEQALTIARQIKDRRGERGALNGLGRSHNMLSQWEKAIGYFEQELVIVREINDRSGERRALNNLGEVYGSFSQNEKAIGYYEQALTIAREIKDRLGESIEFFNLGVSYEGLSQYEKGIGYYEQALAISREIKNRDGEAFGMHVLGSAYDHLEQHEKAIGYYEQSLAMSRESRNRAGEGFDLSSLGSAHGSLRHYERASGYYEQALAISREIKNRALEGDALNNLGVMNKSLSQYEEAIRYFQLALAISREIKERLGEGVTLNNLGHCYMSLSQYEKTIDYLGSALAIAREVKARDLEVETLSGFMDAWSASGNPRLGIFYGKQAINTTQSIRSDISGLSHELQQSFLKGNEKPYHTLAELLIAQGRLAESEQVLALLKEEEYFQYIRRDASEVSSLNRRADLTSDEADWEKRYREIGDQLMAIGTKRGELLAKKTPLSADETRRLEKLDNDISVGNQKFEQFLGDLSQHFSAKVDASRRIEELRETQGIMEDLRELPAGTVAIYTLVGEDRFHAILRTPDAQKAFEYPIKGNDLNRKVLEFREAVGDPRLDPRPLAQELYKILVAGMAEDLRQAKAQTLMWSLDGALRYVPLAALYDGKQYLIEQYRMSVMTLASSTRLMARPDNRWKAAGFGVTKAYEGAAALPSGSQELAGIIATKPGERGVLSGEIRLDGQFTLPTMRQTLLKHYPVVHIASHFRFQPGNDVNSFLLLGDGGHLSLAELRTSANMFGGVQLLTLSACNTGVGDGSEVEGFGALAQRQGAKAVIASLWSVADESTSLLMQKFYRIRESAPQATKLEALSQAQLALLRGTMKGGQSAIADRALVVVSGEGKVPVQAPKFPLDPKAPYAHPYYWAPFFLMGNWL